MDLANSVLQIAYLQLIPKGRRLDRDNEKRNVVSKIRHDH